MVAKLLTAKKFVASHYTHRSGLEQEDMRILYKYLVTSLFPSTIDLEVLNMLSAYFNLTLYLQDWMCNSLYCQLYNSYKISLENLVLDQLIIPKFMFFSILITYLFDIVLILYWYCKEKFCVGHSWDWKIVQL